MYVHTDCGDIAMSVHNDVNGNSGAHLSSSCGVCVCSHM